VQREARQRAERGGNHGGIRAYGFTPEGEVIKAERDVIRNAAGQILAGFSLRTIAADLNTAGTPTATGKGRWTGATLRDVLVKPRCAGLTVHNGVEVGALPGDPILFREQWAAVVDKLNTETVTWKDANGVLRSPPRRNQVGRPAAWLGTGSTAAPAAP
jgi:site-specific DNA recombinase